MQNSAGKFWKAAVIIAWATVAGAQDLNLRNFPNLNQAVRSGWVQFRIISGRVSLDSSRVGNFQSAHNFGRQQDQISIQSDNGETQLTYNWSSDKRRFSLEISHVSKFRISLADPADETLAPVEYHQPLQGKFTLKLGPEEKQRVYSASTIWHLFLAYPQQSRQHLEPLLELLNPQWRISETAAAVENELLRRINNEEVSPQKHWAELVAQLGDESFAKRQAADRALRAASPIVLSYLQQLDFSRLDAEQQFRVRRIIEALGERLGDDSPEQVAALLAGDPAVWLIMLTRPDPATRQKAAQQLSALLGQPIAVDPQADPATQKTQIEQLRLRIESPPKHPEE